MNMQQGEIMTLQYYFKADDKNVEILMISFALVTGFH